jgi:glycosyltransferase involved in cell wall biosynthesis
MTAKSTRWIETIRAYEMLRPFRSRPTRTAQTGHTSNEGGTATAASGAAPTVVEIAAYPPPLGSWALRIGFVAEQLEARGCECLRLNIGRSRTLGDPQYLNARGPLHYLKTVLTLARRGCIIHTHTNGKGLKGTLLAAVAQCIALPFGRRSVLTFHAGVQQEYFPRSEKAWLNLLMKLTFVTPRAIICNSEAVKRRIVEDYGIAAEKVTPIPAFCGAYMKTEIGTLSPPVERFFTSHGPVIALYVFFFHPEFTVDVALRAIARLKAAYPRLGLIIMGSRLYSENYEALIDDLRMRDDVLLTGNLPRSEFLRVLQCASLYLRTPIGDGVAASVLEASALRVPVVASDNGTRPPSCVLYRPGDVEDMVDKIVYVLRNREAVAAQITAPDEADTVEREVDLLLSV